MASAIRTQAATKRERDRFSIADNRQGHSETTDAKKTLARAALRCMLAESNPWIRCRARSLLLTGLFFTFENVVCWKAQVQILSWKLCGSLEATRRCRPELNISWC